MTEAEWREETDPHVMLRQLVRVGAGYRKMRLFSVACCRRIENLIPNQAGLQIVALAEQFADGRITLDALKQVHGWANSVVGPEWLMRHIHGWEEPAIAATMAAARAVDALTSQVWLFWETVRSQAARAAPDGRAERRYQCDVLRDLFSYPFRPISINESWLRWNASTIPRIAQGIYDERAFDRLPILHDALLDAGCDNDDILAHCRGAGPHVRGCWVIDLLLGKS